MTQFLSGYKIDEAENKFPTSTAGGRYVIIFTEVPK